MTDHMQAAIEAVAEELNPGLFSLSDHRYSIRFDNPVGYRAEHQADVLVDVGIALHAALPHIRAMIAQEILGADYDRSPNYGYSARDISVAQEAVRDAARIAKGPQQ